MRRATRLLRQLKTAARNVHANAYSQRGAVSQERTHQFGGAQRVPWRAALGSALLATALTEVLAGPEVLEPEALREMARSLQDGSTADKEVTVASLTGLTPYVEHHTALLQAGLLPALSRCVLDEECVPQLRVHALRCLADLAVDPAAQRAFLDTPGLLRCTLAAVEGGANWACRNAPEEGNTARAAAVRALAALAGQPRQHAALLRAGAVDVLAGHGAETAEESEAAGATYASLGAVPGSLVALHNVEAEVHTAAALYSLAATPEGAAALLAHPARPVRGFVRWSRSRDHVLRRFGAGALARLVAQDGAAGFGAVAEAGGLRALVEALGGADPQAACAAAGALGLGVQKGRAQAAAVVEAGLPAALAAMLEGQPTAWWKESSEGVRKGVLRCALRLVARASSDPPAVAALHRAQLMRLLQELQGGALAQKDPAFQAEVREALSRLGPEE